MMNAIADGKQEAAGVTARMVFDELKVALMDRRRLELKREGIDLSRHVYAPRPDDRARVYCHTHLEKCNVQCVAGKKDGDADFILDVSALRAVAKELEEEKPEWYHALVAALEKTTDMQSQGALTYLLIEPKFRERLKERGHLKEYAWAKIMGMVVAAYDMDGLTQHQRTHILEKLHMLLIYNIVGDQIFLPFGAKKGQAKGVRATHFAGFAAGNCLAFAANVGVRAWLRRTKPRAYAHLNETSFSQNDVENYNGEMAQQMGFKPEESKVEARAARTDYRSSVKHDASRRNFRLRGSKRKYDFCNYSDDHTTLGWWNAGHAMDPLGTRRRSYYMPIAKRARSDAKTRTAFVRSFHKAYRLGAAPAIT